jgi:hypothetical protein
VRRNAPTSTFRGLAALAAALALTSLAPAARAQTENFDSGALGAGWKTYQFFPQNYTFPASGSGKAFRIQAGPVPGAAPAAAAITHSASYTDFYVAVDIVDWVVADQALVLLAQWTPGGDDGLSEGTGMILNYDAAQDGEGPGDRKGGQFQINAISPGFAAATKAVAEISLEPGRSYRFVFQGVGTQYTGRIYDLHDLTAPLVTIQVEDSSYSSGQCGFLSFSRNGTTGTTDVTIDNYYAGATDPNPAAAPALPPPIAGTPVVVSRTPAKRFANFHPPTSGIGFRARTFSANTINTAATKLYLNGVDVSASLAPLPANGSDVTFATASGALAANTIYSARIELQDAGGDLRSTNTFWFDTFSDSFVATAPVRTIEIEDYNYAGGGSLLGAIPASGLDPDGNPVAPFPAGYYSAVGVPEVDYFKPGGFYNIATAEYRPEDRVQITQGSSLFFAGARDEAGDILDGITSASETYRIHDTQRSQFAAAKVYEYQVRLTSPGDWMNYTRNFAAGDYNVYLRCGSFGATTVFLDRVTGDATVANQTTVRLGAFEVANHLMRLNYRYETLMGDSGPAVVSLSGTNTLRLTLGGTTSKDDRVVVLDYLLLVPVTAEPRLSIRRGASDVTLTWPVIPYDLQSTPSLSSPVWTTIQSGIMQVGNEKVYSVPPVGNVYYRLRRQ